MNNELLQKITTLVKPIVDELSYELYHIEFIKENGEFYLRIYIDKNEGSISSNDCEAVSRRVSEILDIEDPIEEAYFLEVSSPGLNRTLFTEEHFKMFIGREVLVRFTSAINGSKNVTGILESVEEDSITVSSEETTVKVPKSKIKSANLEGEI